MPRNGLFIEYEYCTGCHACEVACKQEHNYSDGKCGIRVDELIAVDGDRVRVDFIPHLTVFCDLCSERTLAGEQPACVKHCQSICMKYGLVSELVKDMEATPRSIIVAPK